MKKIYLASPLGFSELGRMGLRKMIDRLSKHFNITEPFTENAPFGSEIEAILDDEKVDIKTGICQLNAVNMKIGAQNQGLINKSDLVVAILDGPDVDSGTAAEIGYAYAMKKRIFGYRGDFRFSSDNIGSKINLQVEYFIKASGGTIFSTIDELVNALGNKENEKD